MVGATETYRRRTVTLLSPSKEDKPGKQIERRTVKVGRKRGKEGIGRKDVGGERKKSN